jgi:hypothetical protein
LSGIPPTFGISNAEDSIDDRKVRRVRETEWRLARAVNKAIKIHDINPKTTTATIIQPLRVITDPLLLAFLIRVCHRSHHGRGNPFQHLLPNVEQHSDMIQYNGDASMIDDLAYPSVCVGSS